MKGELNAVFTDSRIVSLPPDTVGASGEWPSLEARAEHIADAYKRGLNKTQWQKTYDRALAHLRAVATANEISEAAKRWELARTEAVAKASRGTLEECGRAFTALAEAEYALSVLVTRK